MPASRKNAPRRTQRHRSAPPVAEAGPLRQLWLAGLGAAVASSEAAVGMLDLLVARGRAQEPKTLAVAGQVAGGIRDNAQRLVRQATSESKKVVDRTLKQLGVPDQPRQKNILHRLGDLAEALL